MQETGFDDPEEELRMSFFSTSVSGCIDASDLPSFATPPANRFVMEALAFVFLFLATFPALYFACPTNFSQLEACLYKLNGAPVVVLDLHPDFAHDFAIPNSDAKEVIDQYTDSSSIFSNRLDNMVSAQRHHSIGKAARLAVVS